jgi:hypothetical protein
MTPRRLASVLVAVLLGTAAGTVTAAPATAASGFCPRGTGVTVVVDRGSLGGGTSVGCDPRGAGTAASTVVPRAGFPLSYVTRQPGFVCRVAGVPDASRESCGATPPADAYWGLFWSNGRSGTWTYSSVGVGSLQVPAGGFVGWRWQDGGGRAVPGTRPVSTVAAGPTPQPSPRPTPTPSPKASPKPTPRPTTGPTTGPSAGPTPRPGASTSPRGSGPSSGPSRSTSSPGRRATPTGDPSPTKKARKPAASATTSPTPRPTPSPASSATDDVPSAATAPSTDPTVAGTAASGSTSAGERGQGSTGVGLPLAAGGLVGALLVTAGALAWRRRGA